MELCGSKEAISSVAQEKAILEERLKAVRGLLVIYDIWRAEQQTALLLPMGPQSRVLITTRNIKSIVHQSVPCPLMLN